MEQEGLTEVKREVPGIGNGLFTALGKGAISLLEVNFLLYKQNF